MPTWQVLRRLKLLWYPIKASQGSQVDKSQEVWTNKCCFWSWTFMGALRTSQQILIFIFYSGLSLNNIPGPHAFHSISCQTKQRAICKNVQTMKTISQTCFQIFLLWSLSLRGKLIEWSIAKCLRVNNGHGIYNDFSGGSHKSSEKLNILQVPLSFIGLLL